MTTGLESQRAAVCGVGEPRHRLLLTHQTDKELIGYDNAVEWKRMHQ